MRRQLNPKTTTIEDLESWTETVERLPGVRQSLVATAMGLVEQAHAAKEVFDNELQRIAEQYGIEVVRIVDATWNEDEIAAADEEGS